MPNMSRSIVWTGGSKRSTRVAGSLSLIAALIACGGEGTHTEDTTSSARTAYLPRAHSHNDYARGRPLLDAVERGFASVEVDIFLIDGELFVAHEREEVRPSATLTRLYLDPLRDLVRRGGGWIYPPSEQSLQLLIDVKTPADETYGALDRTLAAYEDILTRWSAQGPTQGAVTAVLSGNRAIRLLLADTSRYVALDGRVDDERASLSNDVMPLVSMDWAEIEPTAPNGRLAKAGELIELMHEEGRKVRFWGTPDEEGIWASLISLGADYIVTDDTGRLQRFLLGL
jgi:glycerophosphoryl diester phosphodiesterase